MPFFFSLFFLVGNGDKFPGHGKMKLLRTTRES
jgi:hypothetical protein